MSVRYDGDRIKRPNEELEYTQEQILELEKCAGNVYEFIKHVKIVNIDEGEIPFEPYVYQDKLLRAITKNRFVCSMQFRQSGKCVHSESLIKVRNKKTGKIESIPIEKFFSKFQLENETISQTRTAL